MRVGESLKLSQVCKWNKAEKHSVVLTGISGVNNVEKSCVLCLDNDPLSF